jgi:hypothetical protein
MFTEWAQRMRARGYPVEEALGGIMGEDAWRLVDSPATYEAIRNKVATDAALEAMIDDVARKNGEIIFVLHEGVSKEHTPSTWVELQHILSDPDILSKATFIVDWYY